MRKRLIGLAAALALIGGGAMAQDHGRHGGYGRGGFERGGFDHGGYQGEQFAPRRDFGRAGFGPEGYPGGRGPYAPPPIPGGGYRGFTRGQFLPPAYWRGGVADPRQYHLRRPPNGYGWVTVGPNAYLTQRSTGLILDTAPLY
jgi:Ni/Co efflux regulator RcnB